MKINILRSLMIGNCGYPFYPNSKKWKEIIDKKNKISFWTDTDWGEVDYGYIQKEGDHWIYYYSKGGEETKICIPYESFDWFCLHYYWHNSSEDEKLNSEIKPLDNHLLMGSFSIVKKYFDIKRFNKICSDFINRNPDAKISISHNEAEDKQKTSDFKPLDNHLLGKLFFMAKKYFGIKRFKKICSGFTNRNPDAKTSMLHDDAEYDYLEFDITKYKGNKYNIVSNIKFKIQSDTGIIIQDFFRITKLLSMMSSGDEKDNEFFDTYYLHKSNMFIDDEIWIGPDNKKDLEWHQLCCNDEEDEYGGMFDLCCFYAKWGENEDAFKLLDSLFSTTDDSLKLKERIEADGSFDSFRETELYKELLKNKKVV